VKVSNFAEITAYNNPYEGFLKIKIRAPRKLFIPVLPLRIPMEDGPPKLVFCLCVKCAKGNQNEDCTHTDEEREFITTVTHIELNAALKRGYTVYLN